MTQVREEVTFTAGRIIVRGKMVARGKSKRADYLLYYKPNLPIAIIETKDNKHSLGAGMQQALEYGEILDIPFIFSSNGDGFLFHGRTIMLKWEQDQARHKATLAFISQAYQDFPRRAYLPKFLSLIRQEGINRALILLGPRRVGKTILVYHAIQYLLDKAGVSGRDILYLSLETPIYTGLTLESLVQRFQRLLTRPDNTRLYIFFDEIQYLKDWEIHLKSLVDQYRGIRFIATGSAATALQAKSAESGAGRFTDFVLPPLTFAEYLRFIEIEEELISADRDNQGKPYYTAQEIFRLNETFIDYLNFGGYPEAVFSDAVRKNPRRYIKSDIIDKVLLRDLPMLYGISDIQELNSLFNTLAYNTGQELSIDNLSKTSHVAKNTLNKYLDYLEAAFLIKRIRRVDQNAKRFKRMMTFKVYLTNPTMRAALFGPVGTSHAAIGTLVETLCSVSGCTTLILLTRCIMRVGIRGKLTWSVSIWSNTIPVLL